jgi:5-methylcytosine-specific restriction endonuclease McrA
MSFIDRVLGDNEDLRIAKGFDKDEWAKITWRAGYEAHYRYSGTYNGTKRRYLEAVTSKAEAEAMRERALAEDAARLEAIKAIEVERNERARRARIEAEADRRRLDAEAKRAFIARREAEVAKYGPGCHRRTFGQSLTAQIAARDGMVCKIGNHPIPEGMPVQIDHIIPFSKGGLTILDNGQMACATCNASKGARVA